MQKRWPADAGRRGSGPRESQAAHRPRPAHPVDRVDLGLDRLLATASRSSPPDPTKWQPSGRARRAAPQRKTPSSFTFSGARHGGSVARSADRVAGGSSSRGHFWSSADLVPYRLVPSRNSFLRGVRAALRPARTERISDESRARSRPRRHRCPTPRPGIGRAHPRYRVKQALAAARWCPERAGAPRRKDSVARALAARARRTYRSGQDADRGLMVGETSDRLSGH